MKKLCTYGFLLFGLVVFGASSAQAQSVTVTADVENFGASEGDPEFFAGTVDEAVVVLSLPAITSLDTIDLELASGYLSDLEFKITDPSGTELVLIDFESDTGTGAHDDASPLGFNGETDPFGGHGNLDDPNTVQNFQDEGDRQILLSQTELYTLDPNASVPLNDHFANPFSSGFRAPLAPGVYRTGEPTTGDFDGDDDADGADFLQWQRDWAGFETSRSLAAWQDGFGGTAAQAVWPTGGFPAGDWTLTLTDGFTFNDPASLGDVTFNYTELPSVSAVPEPGSALLLLAGCSLFGLARRRQR